MKHTFWVIDEYFGGDATLIEQAARECGARLVAVRGYPLADYPDDKEYVEGKAIYLFCVERESGKQDIKAARQEAFDTVYLDIHSRVAALFAEKYPDEDVE